MQNWDNKQRPSIRIKKEYGNASEIQDSVAALLYLAEKEQLN